MLTPNDVFTPGQLPIHPTNIYANRGASEKLFTKTLARGMVPVVYGEYGVGKTSMARYALREKDEAGLLVNIESVADQKLDAVFARCLEKLGYTVQTKKTTSATHSNTHEQSAQAGASVGGWANAVVASKRTNSSGSASQKEEQFVVTSPTDSKIIEVCEEAGVALLIDELHRATPDFSEELAKFIKSYGNANCKKFRIVLLGTASDASKLVSSDPGIDRLIQEVHLTSMTNFESEYVVNEGMKALAITIEQNVIDKLVKTCVGSPSILQYLCLEVAEAAFERTPRKVLATDVQNAVDSFVETKMARLNKAYISAIESTGEIRYRKQILRAMAECDDEYVTMEMIKNRVSTYLGKDVPSTSLSGPLRDLKDERYGPVLNDVERPEGVDRLNNYTTFKDPALKAFVRLQVLREEGSSETK
ncbi:MULTISPECIES: P-loop NTPase fold protein [unclassified Acidovorax]|uniref:P-loop NTPase fold protein n=1 Tax=unclassified Acidovorax TaxID=2684926 RepID=UPI000AEF4C63|nr:MULTISPECIES: P-loop NTPase fold protein [unclassified Acidovorax]